MLKSESTVNREKITINTLQMRQDVVFGSVIEKEHLFI